MGTWPHGDSGVHGLPVPAVANKPNTLPTSACPLSLHSLTSYQEQPRARAVEYILPKVGGGEEECVGRQRALVPLLLLLLVKVLLLLLLVVPLLLLLLVGVPARRCTSTGAGQEALLQWPWKEAAAPCQPPPGAPFLPPKAI